MRYCARSGRHFILKGENILICLHIQCVPVPMEGVKTPGSKRFPQRWWPYIYDKVAVVEATATAKLLK